MLDDIETILKDAGIQDEISIGKMPDTDNAIALFMTGGYNPEYSLGRKEYDRPTFQVRVRCAREKGAYSAGESKIAAIKAALDGKTNLTINNTPIIEIKRQGDTLPWRDDNDRPCFSLNYEVRAKY